MRAKQFLSQVRRLDGIIDRKLEAAEKLQSTITNCTSVMSDEPRGGFNPASKSDAILALVELREELNADIDRLVDAKRQVCEVIYELENPLQLDVLHRRYVEYQTWEQIAYECHIHYSHSHRIHQAGLECVQELIDRKHDTK